MSSSSVLLVNLLLMFVKFEPVRLVMMGLLKLFVSATLFACTSVKCGAKQRKQIIFFDLCSL